ncbi:galactofuranosyltransferase [Phocaeicola sp.]
MKKYQIIWAHRDGKSDIIVGNAASKAPQDVTLIARQCGYTDKNVLTTRYKNKILDVFFRLFNLIHTIRSCEKDSIILLQYPCFNENIFPYITFFLKKRKLIAVVHDMNSIREHGTISKAEIKSLSAFREIIVHSPEMKNYLEPYLPKHIRFHILGCFPYLTDSKYTVAPLSNEICFAGNIDKSIFLHKFLPIIHSIHLKLFGRMENKLNLDGKADYFGMFNPDEISSLQGSWGLVWDGIALDSCSGSWGEYLRIIAPHKFSLYIAANIPVIVWDQSAMAQVVHEKKIGITISSLHELEEKIATVTESQYEQLKSNLQAVTQEVRKGSMLSMILDR